MKRAWLAAGLGALACSQDPVVVPVRNLERPSDMTFLCLEVGQTLKPPKLTGRPIDECHNPLTVDRNPLADNPRTFGTFALVSNSARGEVAVVDVDRGRLVDLDPAVPGYNMVPVGSFPESIASSPDGCLALTANRGSCDFTAIDPQRLLGPPFVTEPSTGTGAVTTRMVPTTASGQMLRAAPQEVLFLPHPADGLKQQVNAEHICSIEQAYFGTDPVSKAEIFAPRRALVSFSGCDLVALLDVPSGRIVSSVYIRADGAHDAGAEPVCPLECGGAVAPPGAPAAAPLRVGALAIVPDGHRAYVGAISAPFITALDVTNDALTIPPENGRIVLHEEPGGVSRLRLSVDPYADWVGRFVGNRGRFLYAIAGDGSVRVVDVTRGEGGQLNERECDVNVDPLFVNPALLAAGCFPFDDPARPLPPRRALASGPGIRIPMVFNPDLSPPVPRDIAFAWLRKPMAMLQMDEGSVDGAFGFLLSSSGSVYVVNVEPTQLVSDVPVLTHSFRNFNLGPRGRGLGVPRVNTVPARNFTVADVPLPVRVPLPPLHGPRLEGIPAGTMHNPLANEMQTAPTWVFFPDRTAVIPQAWAITWEGVLGGADRTTGEISAPGPGGPQGGILDDPGADFCQAGVLPKDVLLMPGCNQDAECRAQPMTVCRQARPGTPGLCMTAAQARDEELTRACAPLLGSRRRYEVVRSTASRLELALKPDELPRTSLNRCQSNADCQTIESFAGYECKEVRSGEEKRCVKPCVSAEGTPDDRLCRVGTVCQTIDGSSAGPLCVEGPPLNPACWPTFAPYKVQAGRAFTVAGQATPRPVTVRRDMNGACVPDPSLHPFLVNRIPLDAPRCANVQDDESDPLGPATRIPMPNPCLFIGNNSDETLTGPTGPHIKALFENPQVRFVLTNLDEYAGDAVSMRFDVSGGFLPDTASFQDDVILTAGVRILTGPNEAPESPSWTGMENGSLSFPYIYVVDQGRTGSSAGGRGQVLRMNPRSASTLGLPRFDSLYSSRPFQVQ